MVIYQAKDFLFQSFAAAPNDLPPSLLSLGGVAHFLSRVCTRFFAIQEWVHKHISSKLCKAPRSFSGAPSCDMDLFHEFSSGLFLDSIITGFLKLNQTLNQGDLCPCASNSKIAEMFPRRDIVINGTSWEKNTDVAFLFGGLTVYRMAHHKNYSSRRTLMT